MSEPVEGAWYWVRIGDEWSPAKRSQSAAGGWTNEDTWEDFNDHVEQWAPINPPQAARVIDNVTELYIFASSGYVNTAKVGEANTTGTRKTAEVTLAVGQRMIVERGDGVMRLEVLPAGERS